MQVIQKTLKFNFATTIALFSGGSKHDRHAKLIMDKIRKASNGNVSFVGVIGNQYAKQFDHVYASSDVLNKWDFQVTRCCNEIVSDSIIIPYRTYTHIKNKMLLNQLLKKNIFDDLSTKRVDGFITVGNYSLSKRIYTALNQYYKKSNKLKPPTILFDLQNAYRSVQNQQFLDYLYYNLPKMPNNMQKYVFPSMCVGYEGVFNGFRYLQKFKKDSKESFVSQNFSYDVSQLVKKARQQYRSKLNINQDSYIFAFAPGNSQKQVKFSIKAFKDGFSKFLQRPTIKNVNKTFFQLFVLLPEDANIANYIKNSLGSLPSNVKVSLIESNDKYGAMCAADFGVLHNGQITVEAAVCQLPATVIDSMNNAQAYLQYLYNGHASPLNVSTNYHGYEDLLGSFTAIGQKISYIMNDHFQRPKLRYYYAKLYRQHIQLMLAKSGQNSKLQLNQSGYDTAAKQIYQVASKYRNMDHNLLYSRDSRRQKLSFQ